MINIDRSSVPAPPALAQASIARERKRAEEFYSIRTVERSQRRFDWGRVIPLLRRACDASLRRLFRDKCAYCESPVAAVGAYNFEHFRPKGGALNLDGLFSPDHYWWLAFEWENMLASCQKCNILKAQRFPVKKRRAAPGVTGAALVAEEPLLLDPCVDHPEEHLFFDEQGSVYSNTDRGQITIEVLALNREDLVITRRNHLEVAQRSIPDLNMIKSLLAPDSPYLAATRQFLQRRLAELRHHHKDSQLRRLGLAIGEPEARPAQAHVESVFRARLKRKESLSVHDTGAAASKAYFSGARRIERIEIHNFKSIRNLQIVMPSATGHESWLVFVGENASGKSSVLQAVALALLGQPHMRKLGLDARNFLTHGEEEGYVKVHLTNLSRPVELSFSRHSRDFTVSPAKEFVLILGYGATRLLPRSSSTTERADRYIRVKNLFNPYAQLHNAERWLASPRRVPDSRFDQLALALRQLLLLNTEDRILRSSRRVYVEIGSERFRLLELSDGYQSVVALATDIMTALSRRWEAIDLAEGVVLIDEIETHLHPVWKLEIVSRLRRMFPRLHFLVTTHDPLCLRGTFPGEIHVLHRSGSDVTADVVNQPIDHLRADQLLTSPLFGLLTTRAPEFQSLTDRYARLLGKSQRTRDEEKELLSLRGKLAAQIQSGETPSERYVEQAVRQAVSTLAAAPPADAPVPPMDETVRLEIRNKLKTLLGEV